MKKGSKKKESKRINHLLDDFKRIVLIVTASFIMAMNITSFVQAGGLVPGGFTGLSLLIQRSFMNFFEVALPFTVINFILNAIPAIISYKVIGKKFTVYSCIMIILTSIFTDILPTMDITNDILLVCIFGGIINGFAIGLCIWGGATSGGTDFIAFYFSEKLHIDVWNYILLGNAVVLVISGFLFGWDKALYSIIFQFTSIQLVKMLNIRYKKATLFIITSQVEPIYEAIKDDARHGATVFKGIGLYKNEPREMIYTVISESQIKQVSRHVREVDSDAFINVIRTNQVEGNFYIEPHD